MTRPSLLRLPLVAAALASLTVLAACSDAVTSSGGLSKKSSRRTPTTASGGEESTGDDGVGSPDNVTGGSGGNAGGSVSNNPGTTTGTAGSSAGTPGGSENPGTPAGDFDVLVANAQVALDLQAETTFQVTVAPKNGFSGSVALSATGLPTGATATFAPASVTLSGTTGATSTVTVKSGSAAPGDAPFKVVGTGGAITKQADATLKVNAKLTIKIPQNANDLAKVFDDVEVSKGAGNLQVVWENTTNEVTVIHRQNNGAGMSHGNNIAPGGNEARNVTATGTFIFYMHSGRDQNSPGRLIVK